MKPSNLPHLAVLAGLLLLPCASADEPKNHDFDVVRDKAAVLPYQLPPILVTAAGPPVTTLEEWFNIRRPQIMALFGNLIYGVVPKPESPVRATFEVVRKDASYLGGKATRKDVRIKFENSNGSAEMQIWDFNPNGVAKPVPAFLLHSFAGTRDDGHDAHPDKPRWRSHKWIHLCSVIRSQVQTRGKSCFFFPSRYLERRSHFQRWIHLSEQTWVIFGERYRARLHSERSSAWRILQTRLRLCRRAAERVGPAQRGRSSRGPAHVAGLHRAATDLCREWRRGSLGRPARRIPVRLPYERSVSPAR